MDIEYVKRDEIKLYPEIKGDHILIWFVFNINCPKKTVRLWFLALQLLQSYYWTLGPTVIAAAAVIAKSKELSLQRPQWKQPSTIIWIKELNYNLPDTIY